MLEIQEAASKALTEYGTPNTQQGVRVEETPDAITLTGAGYSLTIARAEPAAELRLNGRLVTTLQMASGLDTMDGADEETWLDPPTLLQDGDAWVVTWGGNSPRWQAKQITLRAWAGGFSYGYRVEGTGALDRAQFFRTRGTASPATDVRLFDPEPNSGAVRYTGDHCTPGKHCVMCIPSPVTGRIEYSGPQDYMTITVGRDKDYHEGNWFFTPSPFCYAVEGAGNWLGLGIVAQPGSWNFTDMEYPGDGFGFSLLYQGHVEVDGAWESPQMLCLVAPDEYTAVEQYCDWLRAHRLAPAHGRGPVQAWWREPMFCGWGEQVSEEFHEGLSKVSNVATPRASDRATQTNYEQWLHALESQGLDPGTVVIDDKWQLHYGLNDVDPAKWPDLPGFIAAQHARGRHVLLWLKAWDPAGVPLEECILDAEGNPLAVDPGNPAFQVRFAEQVRWMLQDLDADGFKVDFTHLIPRGMAPRSAGGRWGLELLRQWLAILSDAARAAKPDTLIITHTANPYLADLVDMLRLNDVAGLDDVEASIVPDMTHRTRTARAASPYWLIDADNWPCLTRVQWRDYIQAQGTGDFGVPSLYHAERLGWGPTDDPLQAEDYAAVRQAWASYRALTHSGVTSK